LFSVIYPVYNAFAQSSNNDDSDNTDQEEKDKVECDKGEELKGEDCVPIECDKGEELKGEDCVPIECDKGEELKGEDCVPIECDKGEELKGEDCVPISGITTSPDSVETEASVPSSAVLKLDPISDVKPGDPIKIEGTLKTKSDGTGIEGKTVTLAVTGMQNPPTGLTASTEGGGKFSFTIPGSASVEGGSVTFEASFGGDSQYLGTSKEVTYEPKGGIATDIVSLEVKPGDQVIIQGTLITKSDGTGIDDRVIALERKAIENLDIVKSYNTKGGGKFTFTIPGNALGESTPNIPRPPIGGGSAALVKQPLDENSVNLQVHFKGDGQYAETSEPVIIPAQGVVPTDIVSLEVKPGDPITILGTLIDTDGNGIDGKTMKLAGTVIENLPDEKKTASTEGGGKFTFTIPGNVLRASTSPAPNKPPIDGELSSPGNVPIRGGSVTFEAIFEGDSEYLKKSKEVTYQPHGGIHTDIANLEVKPDRITIQGTLVDTDSNGIDGKTIILTLRQLRADGSIIGGPHYSVTTSGDGTFTFEDEGVLSQLGLWEIQSIFGGDLDYGPSRDTTIYGTAPAGMSSVQVRDVLLGEEPNKKPVETKLPTPPPTIPGASYNSSGPCHFNGDYVMPVRGDTLHEVEKKGNDLIYKAKDKSKFKTFEYSMIYDCPDPIPPPPPEPTTTPSPQDNAAPGAPVIESPSTGTQKIVISQISGTAEPDTTVTVFNGGTYLDTTPADSNGHWSLSTSLQDGTYSFTAMATDNAGNTGDPSTAVNVVVDTSAPDTKIESATDGNGDAISNDFQSTSNNITFTFSGAPPSDVDHFVCSIDGGPDIPCASPKTFTGMAIETFHTFKVAAVDATGNIDQSPEQLKWKVVVLVP
jgi:Bacterial Ig-like domain